MIFTLFLYRDIEPLLHNENYLRTEKALRRVGVRRLGCALVELSGKGDSTSSLRPRLLDRGFSYVTSSSEICVKNQPDTAPLPIVVELSISAALHG